MSTEGAIVSADVNGWNVTSNTATKESIAALSKDKAEPEPEPDPSKAASELGKLGGEASAKARAKAAKESKKQQAELGLEAENATEQPEKVEAKPEEDKPEEKPLGKPRDDPRARMLEATRKEAEAKKALAAERAERERERSELQRIREEVEALKRSTKPAEPEANPPQGAKAKPKADDFDDYEAYLDARDEWNREQWTNEQKKHSESAALEQEIDKTFRSFIEATSDIRDTIKDTVGQLASSFQLQPGQKETGGNWIANELIFSPENARPLALFLHEHPDELQRIAALQTPRAVSREMAKLEARLEAATAGNSSESEPAVSKAPPPIKPVSGASYVAEGDAYKPGMSLDDYARNWNKSKRLQR